MKLLYALIVLVSGCIYVSVGQPPTRSNSNITGDHWKVLPASADAVFITFDWQGVLYRIGTDNQMYALDAKDQKWMAVYPGIQVRTMTIKPDKTIIALDIGNKYIYARQNGKWTRTNGFMDQVVAAKDGNVYSLLGGKIAIQGSSGTGSGTAPSVKIKFMSAATNINDLYLIDTDNKLHTFTLGEGISGEIVGGGHAKAICGTGYGTRAGQFINGAGTDNQTYYFEVSPTNKWVPVKSQIYMRFIALDPATNTLYGIGVDNKIYSYSGRF